jgi:CheY-like chemotaxis protein
VIGFLRKKKRILLLDDDVSMQKLVSTLLRRQGYHVDVVGSGRRAIESVRNGAYDALILDLMMPHEGGMTVIAHLRQENPELLRRVVLLTATPESVLKAISREVFGVVRKPFEHEELIDTVRKVIG